MDRNGDLDDQTFDPGPYLVNTSDPASYLDVKTAILQDDFWGFGQVVAMALLLTPVFFLFESVYGKFVRFTNAAFVWTIWNHTKGLSPIESVIRDRTK